MLNSKFLCIGLVSAILMTSFSTNSVEAAKVYTWKDASGVTYYSDKPFPKAKSAKELQINAARPKLKNSDTKANGPKRDLIDPADSKRITAECSKARNNLVTLASGKTIRRTNLEGNQVTLDETAIKSEVQKNQSFINANCSSKSNSQVEEQESSGFNEEDTTDDM